MRFKALVRVVCLMSMTSLAHAEQPIEVNPTADWTHKGSGWVFPPSIGDLQRAGITAVTENGANAINVDYVSEREPGHRAMVLIYRSALPNSGAWIDHVLRDYGEQKGNKDVVKLNLTPFELKGGAGRGLMILTESVARSHPDEGVPARRGKVTALLELGEWRMLVILSAETVFDELKMRDYFSETGIEGSFGGFIEALAGQPISVQSSVPQGTDLCGSELNVKEAALLETVPDLDVHLTSIAKALLSPFTQVRYCRIETAFPRGELYRAIAAEDGYVMLIGPEFTALVVAKVESDHPDGPYAVLLIEFDTVQLLAAFDRMPSISQAQMVLMKHNPGRQNAPKPLAILSRDNVN